MRYRRSKLGPFWITLSMGLMISIMSVVFSVIFKQKISTYLPFLAVSMIIWNFFSTTILESCSCFTEAENIIKQLPVPLFVHVFRAIFRNLIVLFHNFLIIPVIFLVFLKPVGFSALLFFIGILIVALNLCWIATFVAILCTRFRDLPPLFATFLQLVFYITPILWHPNQLSSQLSVYLVKYNPIYHLVEIIRAPLLGEEIYFYSWIVSLSFLFFGCIFSSILLAKYRRKIPYWI